jgi:GNAT superfamily N-acetyltransferase
MQYISGYNIKIYDMYKAYFFAYLVDDNIVGVNSAHRSSEKEFRSRGLYVFEKYRNKGIGKKLLEYSIDLGKSEGCTSCWSVPKKTALSTYLAAGFVQTSTFFKTDTSDENCYVSINL